MKTMVKCEVKSRKWEGHKRGSVVDVPQETLDRCPKDLSRLEEPLSSHEMMPEIKPRKQSRSWKPRKKKASDEESDEE